MAYTSLRAPQARSNDQFSQLGRINSGRLAGIVLILAGEGSRSNTSILFNMDKSALLVPEPECEDISPHVWN